MKRHAVAVAACLGFLGACGDSDLVLGPVMDLELAEARWERAGWDSYVYAVQRMCFCSTESIGPVRVRVQDGAVVERTYVDSGVPVAAQHAPLFPTVEGLFAIIRSALEGDAHEVRVTYDPVLGVPTEFWIDYLEFAADEELGMLVTEEISAQNQVVALQ